MRLKRALLPIFIILISLATLLCFTSCDNGDGGHTHSYKKTVVAPTCTEQGYNLYTCSCEYSYRDTFVNALGHDFVEYISNNDATYEKDGTKTAICERNGCSAVDTIADEGSKLIEGHTHSYSSIVTPPTCTERGYTTHICECNHSYVDTYVDALEHSFTNYVPNGDATYEADGTKTAVCDNIGCGATDKITDVGSKLERLTVQFIADGTIISTQSFDSTNKDIVIPNCPVKNGFIGKWESFTLDDTSIVVNALYVEKTAWDGTSVASSFWDGDGSEERPYTIATAAHLKYLAKTVNEGNSYAGKYFKLCADIDLGGYEWEPIGNGNSDYSNPFSGILDGSNHKISNYKIQQSHNITYYSDDGYVDIGLFGYLKDSKISNLVLHNYEIDVVGERNATNTYFYGGGLAGKAINSSIRNCELLGDINVTITLPNVYFINAYVYVGGVCGSMTNCSLSDCIVNGTTCGSTMGGTSASCFSRVGGLCGYVSGNIMNCSYEGTVSERTSWGGYCGGLVGASYDANIENSTFDGTIGATSGYYMYAGGIAGTQSKTSIMICSALGTINTSTTENKLYVGGISGYLSDSVDKIENSYACCVINGSSRKYSAFCGGIAGYIEKGSIIFCVSDGEISSTGDDQQGYACGIAGLCKGESVNAKIAIENCLAQGKLSGDRIGAIATASNAAFCSFENNHFVHDICDDISSILDGAYATLIDEDTTYDSNFLTATLGLKAFKEESISEGAIWCINSATKTVYHYLSGQVETTYTVKHYIENLNGEYGLVDTSVIKAMSNSFVRPAVKQMDGFVLPSSIIKIVSADGTTTIEYRYARKTYAILLKGNGGNGGYIYPKYQEVLNLETLSTREGYTFGGWFFDAELTEEANINNLSYVEGETLTLYAWWKEENKPSDFSYSTPSGVWINKYIGTDRTVVIPAYIGGVAVSQINSYAFKDNVNLVSLVIPDTVTTINASILQGCTNITSLTIPFVGKNNRTQYSYLDADYILGYFFEIQQVRYDQTPPEGWTKQGTTIKSMYEYGVYSNIPASLSSITITGDAAIPAHAFENCKNIKSYILNEDITIIGEYAFYNSGLTGTVYLPKLVAICEYAFENTNLSHIHLPISVTEIGMYAISSYYNSLVVSCEASAAQPYWNSNWYYGTVNVYWGVTENPSDFSFVYTESGYIIEKYNGSSAVVIVPSVFNDGTNGENAVVGISDYAFYQKDTVAVIIPKSVTSIGASAFKECSNLVAVVLNNGLISIGNNAFRDCSALQSVVIPSTVEIIGERAFQDAGIKNLNILSNSADMGAWVFYSCNDLKNVTIADGTQRIYHGQFEGCDAIETIVLPDTITILGSDAFMNCKSLKTIYIPKTLTTISDWAFYNCSDTLIVEYEGAAADWRNIVVGTNNDTLYSCTINYYNA